MLANVRPSHQRGRRSGALGLAILASAATAASAGAAGLKITVPAHVHRGAAYAIKLTGSYQRSEALGKPYLISLIQFSAARCQASAQLENRRVSSNFLQFYFAPPRASQQVGIFENSSPFTRLDGFTATRIGPRHVCAYLYPKFIGSTDATAPIATADRAYKVTRK
jgi:hypothetical protein